MIVVLILGAIYSVPQRAEEAKRRIEMADTQPKGLILMEGKAGLTNLDNGISGVSA